MWIVRVDDALNGGMISVVIMTGQWPNTGAGAEICLEARRSDDEVVPADVVEVKVELLPAAHLALLLATPPRGSRRASTGS